MSGNVYIYTSTYIAKKIHENKRNIITKREKWPLSQKSNTYQKEDRI